MIKSKNTCTDNNFGAFIISLDFELHWGLRDKKSTSGPYRDNLLGARIVIPRILDLFKEYEIAATWAAVGFLFAKSREELIRFSPTLQPAYRAPELNPYNELIGTDEEQDLFHFAPTLIEQIRKCPRQEIATHTYSHYYCLEPGQDQDSFREDIKSAIEIARANNIQISSIVFPRNQYNPAYDDILIQHGINCYRGHDRFDTLSKKVIILAYRRATRLAASYFGIYRPKMLRWEEVMDSSGLCNVPGSRFLRPFSPRLQILDPLLIRRICSDLRLAAKSKRIFHLWWHPHNFGRNIEENMDRLKQILTEYRIMKDRYQMQSMSMKEAAEHVRARNLNSDQLIES
jgi:peptidoglycan/xylan/chitin deacetylase (PgdA/CDA1 family)